MILRGPDMPALLVIYWLAMGYGAIILDWDEATFVMNAFIGAAVLLGVCWAIRSAAG